MLVTKNKVNMDELVLKNLEKGNTHDCKNTTQIVMMALEKNNY